MLRIFARLVVSRWLWLTLGVVGVLALVFALAAAAAIIAHVVLDRAVGREPDVEMLTAIALILGLLAATAALVGLAVLRVVRRRGRVRRWVPLRQSMLHDAATVPATYLVQIRSRPDATVGGRAQALTCSPAAAAVCGYLARIPPGAWCASPTTPADPWCERG